MGLEFRRVLFRSAMPIIALITLAVFLGYFINVRSPKLEVAVIRSLFSFLSLSVGYYASVLFCLKTTPRFFEKEISKTEAETVVAYSSNTMLGIRLLMSFFPGYFFLQFLYLHTLYILLCMGSDFLQSEDKHRTWFMIINTIAILVFRIVCSNLFLLLIPNIPL